MLTEKPLLITSIAIASAIAKNKIVSVAGTLSAAVQPLGVAADDALAGELTPVAVAGIVNVLNSATPPTLGQFIVSDADGLAIGNDVSGDLDLGICVAVETLYCSVLLK